MKFSGPISEPRCVYPSATRPTELNESVFWPFEPKYKIICFITASLKGLLSNSRCLFVSYRPVTLLSCFWFQCLDSFIQGKIFLLVNLGCFGLVSTASRCAICWCAAAWRAQPKRPPSSAARLKKCWMSGLCIGPPPFDLLKQRWQPSVTWQVSRDPAPLARERPEKRRRQNQGGDWMIHLINSIVRWHE